MFLRSLLVLAFLCLFQPGFNQALTPGDPIPPDLEITNLHNYPVSEIQLQQLSGKLVILDFWSTWCKSCLEALPKLHKLQQEFPNQIQLLLVNTYPSDSFPRVNTIFTKRQLRTGLPMELPYSLQQQQLLQFFPHQLLPHCVWISPSGIYLGASSGQELTAENIRNTLNNKLPDFLTKADNLNFNHYLPIFAQSAKIPNDKLIFQSTITPYIEGLGYRILSNHLENGSFRFCMFNYPLLALYKKAFQLNHLPNHWFQFDALPQDSLNKKFCYELILPPKLQSHQFNRMRTDLELFFHITIREIPRTVKVLKLMPPKNLPRAIHTSNPSRIISLSTLIKHLDLRNGFRVICDDPRQNQSLALPHDFFQQDFPSMLSMLNSLGFKSCTDSLTLPCYVFTKTNPSY